MLHDAFTVDELDLRIVHALQINPRAPWSLVASAAGADRTTVLRRWRRMEEAGAAWICCQPMLALGYALAMVEVSCAHGQALQVAARLAADPHAVTVSVWTGSYDLGMEVFTSDQRDQSRYVLERLAAVDGIRETRTHHVAAYYADASRWRLGQLNAAAERRLAIVAGPPDEAGQAAAAGRGIAITEAHREVAAVLAADPRMPEAALAERLGVSRATAHRRLAGLLAAQPFMRCELARSLTPWPVSASFFLRCPADRLDATAQALSRLREVRVVIATVGHHNLCFTVWVPSVGHVYRLESQLAARMPHIQVSDRVIAIRPVKLMGQLLDEDGRRTGTVPIDLRQCPLQLA